MASSNKYVFPLALVTTAVAMTGAIAQPLLAQSPTITCRYDPSTGTPNPLGMRTFISLTETDGTTEVTYEQLGTMVPGAVEAVLTTQRSLLFPNRSIDAVRQLLVNTPTYYQELVGFADPEGFAPVNATLVCQAEAVAARPAAPRQRAAQPRGAELPDLSALPDNTSEDNLSNGEGITPATFYDTIAGLADGNYRYVSGPAAVDRVYSDQELLNRGGVLFLFQKTGDSIVGSYGYIDGEAICIEGRVSGNTVTGQAYPNDGMALDLAEDFAFWGPATFLKVRRTQGDEGARYYSSATLELGDFSKINSGSSLPPSRCN
ncbi:MAG: hypothetical protein ACFB2W_18455 [Leptolyngbyaceae cyanobacterium]